MTGLVGKLRSAARMGPTNRNLVGEAVLALAVARLRSGLRSFKQLAAHLGGAIPPDAPLPPFPALSIEQEATVRSVRWAVGAVAPWMPFRAVCLQQAIAARAMLARRGIGSVLHLGVDTSTCKMSAHAWLDVGVLKVTGYPVDPAMNEVARFA